MSKIEEIYYNQIDHIKPTKEVEEAENKLFRRLEPLFSRREYVDVECEILAVAATSEENGFIAGFRCATALWRECQ